MSIHKPHSFVTIVELVGGSIGIPGLAHDQDIVAAAERIGEEGAGPNIDVGIVARSLASRRAIKVPLWKVFPAARFLGKCLKRGEPRL